MGTQIHVAGWPSFPAKIYRRDQQDSVDFRVRQFAHEGKIFVISACSVTDKQNVTACCNTTDEKAEIIVGSGGGSAIISPTGEYLAGPVWDGEAVIVAEISLEDALAPKQMHNVVGHYARWDVLSLNFNRQKLEPIRYAGLSSPSGKEATKSS
jgi:predicted amidohydrolase